MKKFFRKLNNTDKRGNTQHAFCYTLLLPIVVILIWVCTYLENSVKTLKIERDNVKMENISLQNDMDTLTKENESLKIEIEKAFSELSEYKEPRSSITSRGASRNERLNDEYLGEFSSTAYCTENYPHICNNGDSTYTATGETPIPYQTVAVDPSIIPLGTSLKIERSDGSVYYVKANDTGGAIKGNKIDIVCPTHTEALQWGRQTVKVWRIN